MAEQVINRANVTSLFSFFDTSRMDRAEHAVNDGTARLSGLVLLRRLIGSKHVEDILSSDFVFKTTDAPVYHPGWNLALNDDGRGGLFFAAIDSLEHGSVRIIAPSNRISGDRDTRFAVGCGVKKIYGSGVPNAFYVTFGEGFDYENFANACDALYQVISLMGAANTVI